jgi:hypothetical protein
MALALTAEMQPELVEQTVAPLVDTIVLGVTTYNRNFTGPAEGFIRVLTEHAPIAWRAVLNKLDPTVVEKNFSECLKGDEDHRRAIAVVIESSITLNSPVGDMARRLRARFPGASSSPTDTPRFSRRRRRSRRKRLGTKTVHA